MGGGAAGGGGGSSVRESLEAFFPIGSEPKDYVAGCDPKCMWGLQLTFSNLLFYY